MIYNLQQDETPTKKRKITTTSGSFANLIEQKDLCSQRMKEAVQKFEKAGDRLKEATEVYDKAKEELDRVRKAVEKEEGEINRKMEQQINEQD